MIPIIIGALAVSSIALGAYNGAKAYSKKEEADKILENLKNKIDDKNSQFKNAKEKLFIDLKELDNLYLEIYNKDFANFEKILKKLGKKLSIQNKKGSQDILSKIDKEISLIESKKISIDLLEDVLETVTSAGVSGILSYYGTVAVASAVGTASTGTAISSLSGVAYTNALLAYLGGGSLAAGGLGITGGIVVLGGITLAPAIAIAGIRANIIAEKYLTEVKKLEKDKEKELARIDIEITKILNEWKKIQQYKKYFLEIRKRFLKSLEELEEIIKTPFYMEEIKEKLTLSIAYAKTLRNLMDNPLDKNMKEVKL